MRDFLRFQLAAAQNGDACARGDFLRFQLSAAQDGDACARGSQPAGHGPAEYARAARYDGDLPLKRKLFPDVHCLLLLT